MKKTMDVFLCAAVLILSLAGCVTGGSPGGGPGESTGEEVADPPSSSGESLPAAGADVVGLAGDPGDAPESESIADDLPVFVWAFDTPESQGMDSALLGSLHSILPGTQVYSMVTVRNGRVVDEFYRDGYDEDSVFQFNSCSKSFTSALMGIALDEGLIEGVDVSIGEYFPQLAGTPKGEITIRHILEHTSGLEWYEFGGDGRSFFALNSSDNWVDYVLERPLVAAPGATFNYTTGGTHLLAAILEQVIDGSLFDYASEHLFTPLNMESVHWRADPQGILDGGNGIEMTARDAAKFGYLFLHGGSWEGAQLVPKAWVEESTSVQVARDANYGSYGYQWWIRPFAGYDAFYAMGAYGQFILVVPELDLVTVITSDRTGGTDTPYSYISNYILAACE